ncbi:MAG: PadR family transcriptional regulator [Thermaerobacter sp.]|nr:PadR family transcriptional regulator [Thermaerobacter sp.]
MKERSQLLKGTLEGCILQVIKGDETYGYAIAEQLRRVGFSSIAEGTVYPLLLRLEKNGLLAATHRDSPLGPKRKYYTLTRQGHDALDEFIANWREVETCVRRLFEEDSDDIRPTAAIE